MSRYSSYHLGGGSGGTDLVTVIQVILIVLKMFDLIDWTWWQVLFPFWGTIIAVVVIGFLRWLIKGGK